MMLNCLNQLVSDWHALQYDVHKLHQWSRFEGFTLNVKKCCVIAFYKIKDSINNVNLSRVDQVKNLGCKLSFNNHIRESQRESSQISLKNLGSIIKDCKDLCVNSYRILYCALFHHISHKVDRYFKKLKKNSMYHFVCYGRNI